MSRHDASTFVARKSWILVALLTACGGSGGGTQSVCDTYLSCLQDAEGAAGNASVYEQAKTAYGSAGACHATAETGKLCEQSCQQGIDALETSGQSCGKKSKSSSGSDGGTPDGGTSNGPAPSSVGCVSDTVCGNSELDCAAGQRCNIALDPPRCQALYCGATGTPCLDDRGDSSSLCEDRVCTLGVCGGSTSTGRTGTSTGTTTPLDCREFISCAESCADDTCQQTCETKSSTTAIDEYTAAVQCMESYCLGTSTAPYKCALSSDGTQFTEIGGGMLQYANNSPSSPCAICLNDASSGLFGQTCVSPASADCVSTNGSAAQRACGTQLAACN